MIERLTNCQLCGSSNFVHLDVGLKDDAYKKLLDLKGEIGWSLCTDCSYIFQNPRATREVQESFYTKSNYRMTNPEPISQGYIDYAPYQLLRFEAWFLMNGYPLRSIQNANCLDYGCGIGGALNFLAEKNNTNFGVELDRQLSDYGNKNHQIKIVPTANDLPADVQFDFIFSHNAVEHVYDPNDFFSFAQKRIKSNGILAVVVPAWRYSNTTESLDEFNASHNTMWDHVSLSNFYNKYGFYMHSYLYSNPNAQGDWDICGIGYRSERKNHYTFDVNDVLAELSTNIRRRYEERLNSGNMYTELVAAQAATS